MMKYQEDDDPLEFFGNCLSDKESSDGWFYLRKL